jgi:hypothetical protein
VTKKIRIENADTSMHEVVVETWAGGVLQKSEPLAQPTAMIDGWVWGGQHLVIREVVTGEGLRPAYQSRVIEEKAALDEKIKKLRKFVGSPAWESATDKVLLIDQVAAMDSYSAILGKRIEGFDA